MLLLQLIVMYSSPKPSRDEPDICSSTDPTFIRGSLVLCRVNRIYSGPIGQAGNLVPQGREKRGEGK